VGPGVVDQFTDMAYIQFVTPNSMDYIIQKVNLTDLTVIADEIITLEGATHVAFITLNGPSLSLSLFPSVSTFWIPSSCVLSHQ
jgi:hypothetical protein